MRRIVLFILAVSLVICSLNVLAEGSTWYCPKCGLKNTDNFCPRDGTARPEVMGGTSEAGEEATSVQNNAENAIEIKDNTIERIPSLSEMFQAVKVRGRVYGADGTGRHQAYAGPGSDYSQCGAYKSKVMKLVDAFFEEEGYVFVKLNDRYQYFKRSAFDSLSGIPAIEELEYSYAVTKTQITPSWGPGSQYNQIKDYYVISNVLVKVFFEENGYAYAEYSCSAGLVRMWLPKEYLVEGNTPIEGDSFSVMQFVKRNTQESSVIVTPAPTTTETITDSPTDDWTDWPTDEPTTETDPTTEDPTEVTSEPPTEDPTLSPAEIELLGGDEGQSSGGGDAGDPDLAALEP